MRRSILDNRSQVPSPQYPDCGCRFLDVTYREDESRIHEEALRENFAWLNRFTLSLLKQHPDRTSIAMKRRSCGWNDDYLMQVLTGSTN